MKIDGKFILPTLDDFESPQDHSIHIKNSRKKCDKRGYHKVVHDYSNSLLCYDCNFWFGKDEGIKYKVENPF